MSSSSSNAAAGAAILQTAPLAILGEEMAAIYQAYGKIKIPSYQRILLS